MSPSKATFLIVCSCISAPALLGQDARDAERPLPRAALVRLGTHRVQHVPDVRHAVFSPDGKVLALANDLWPVSYWHMPSGKEIPPPATAKNTYDVRPHEIAFSPDGRLLACRGGIVQIVDMAAGKQVRLLNPEQGIVAMAFSPDSKRIATATGIYADSRSFDIVLWEIATGREVRRYSGHPTRVNALAFSADGTRLISLKYADERGEKPGLNGEVVSWDVATGKQLRARTEIAPGVLSRDGKLLTTHAKPGELQLWNIEKQRLLHTLATPDMRSAAALKGNASSTSHLFSPDGKLLVAMDQSGLVRLWEVESGRLVKKFQGPAPKGEDDRTFLFDFAPDGNRLVTGSVTTGNNAGSPRLWDLSTGKEVLPPETHQSAITCLAFAPDGKTLLSGSRDRSVRQWDAASGKLLQLFPGHETAVAGVAVAVDGKTIAASALDRSLRIWDSTTARELHRFNAIDELVPVRFSRDGKELYWKDAKEGVQGCAIPSGRLLRPSLASAAGKPVAWKPVGRSMVREPAILTSAAAAQLLYQRFWDPKSRKEPSALYGVAVSDDGRLLATAEGPTDWGGETGPRYFIHIWEVAGGGEIARLGPAPHGFPGASCSLAFSRDGWKLISANRLPYYDVDPDLCVWDLTTGKAVPLQAADTPHRRGHGHHGQILCLAISADGTRLASGSTDATAIIWDLAAFSKLPHQPLSAEALEHCWAELALPNAKEAYLAMHRLVCSPREALPFVADRLRKLPPAGASRIPELIARLSDDKYRVRAQAMKDLESLGKWADSGLRRTLASSPALEVKRRIEHLLARNSRPFPDQLTILRGTSTLGKIATAEARRALHDLANEFPDTPLAAEAAACRE